jgi:hypothetical protein
MIRRAPLRIMGIATAAYGLWAWARPDALARATGAAAPGDPALTAWSRTYGVRDMAGGVALAIAPAGPALATAVALRLAVDLGDAAVLAQLPAIDTRRRLVPICLGWAALTALAARLARTS